MPRRLASKGQAAVWRAPSACESARSLLMPLKDLQPRLSGAFGHPRAAATGLEPASMPILFCSSHEGGEGENFFPNKNPKGIYSSQVLCDSTIY